MQTDSSSLAQSHPLSSPGASSPASPRRRAHMRINLNEPAIPGPNEAYASQKSSPQDNGVWRSPQQERRSPLGVRASPQLMGTPDARTADPHHQRTPSLGELHQELEQEQEGQVNRLLQMIRQQQIQLHQLQSANSNVASTTSNPTATSNANLASTSAIEASTPSSERSISLSAPLHPPNHPSSARTRSPATRSPAPANGHRSGLSREGSQRSASPGWRAMHNSTTTGSQEDSMSGGGAGRDELGYYQAETSALTRENQMLKVRIKELERLLSEMKVVV